MLFDPQDNPNRNNALNNQREKILQINKQKNRADSNTKLEP